MIFDITYFKGFALTMNFRLEKINCRQLSVEKVPNLARSDKKSMKGGLTGWKNKLSLVRGFYQFL